MLRGKFHLRKLQQVFEDHQSITGGELKQRLGPNNGIFEYIFEAEAGIAEINVLALDTNQPDYADRVLFRYSICSRGIELSLYILSITWNRLLISASDIGLIDGIGAPH